MHDQGYALLGENKPSHSNKKKLLVALGALAVVGVVVGCVVGLRGESTNTFAATNEANESYEFLFQKFTKQFGKQYSESEFAARFMTFKRNLDYITYHNEQNYEYKLAINEFADMTKEEFRGKKLGSYPRPPALSEKIEVDTSLIGVTDVPTEMDWTTKKAVTDVKNQQQCGSCWAFSTTGAVEGAWAIAKNQLVALSEQELVDCSAKEGNQGCNGGLMDQGFQYIIDNKGICAESDYPYTAKDGKCKSTCKKVVTISSFKDVPQNDENALMAAVAQQPVAVAIEADQSGFQFYSSGVFSGPCGTQLDHGVLAVGYGVQNGTPYWKVKNSWGASWGDKGYILLKRGTKTGEAGLCGIAMQPSYPVV